MVRWNMKVVDGFGWGRNVGSDDGVIGEEQCCSLIIYWTVAF